MFDYALERDLVSYVSPKLLYEFTGFYFDDDILPGDVGIGENIGKNKVILELIII